MSFTVPAWLDCTHFEELKSLKKAKIWPILRFTLSPGWDKNKQTNSWCCGGRIHLLYAANNQHIKLELKKDVPNFKTFWGCRVSFMRSQKLLSFISQICCISLSYPLLMTTNKFTPLNASLSTSKGVINVPASPHSWSSFCILHNYSVKHWVIRFSIQVSKSWMTHSYRYMTGRQKTNKQTSAPESLFSSKNRVTNVIKAFLKVLVWILWKQTYA